MNVQPGEERVEVFDNKTRVFKKQQERKVVDEADQEPDFAAAVKSPCSHQQHKRAEKRHGRPECARAEKCQRQDSHRGGQREEESKFQHAVIESPSREARQHVDATSFPRAMIHQCYKAEIKDSRVKHQRQVVRVPPAVEEIGGNCQPRKPQARPAQRVKDRHDNQDEYEKWPGMEKHSAAGKRQSWQSLAVQRRVQGGSHRPSRRSLRRMKPAGGHSRILGDSRILRKSETRKRSSLGGSLSRWHWFATGLRRAKPCTPSPRWQRPNTSPPKSGGGPKLGKKPRLGVIPPALGCGFGNVEPVSSFLNCHPDEIPEFNQLCLPEIDGSESRQGLVNDQKLVVGRRSGEFHVLNIHSHLSATVPEGFAAPGTFNENAPHRLRGGGEKMGTPRPNLPVASSEA